VECQGANILAKKEFELLYLAGVRRAVFFSATKPQPDLGVDVIVGDRTIDAYPQDPPGSWRGLHHHGKGVDISLNYKDSAIPVIYERCNCNPHFL
jgi:hypothetical protein